MSGRFSAHVSGSSDVPGQVDLEVGVFGHVPVTLAVGTLQSRQNRIVVECPQCGRAEGQGRPERLRDPLCVTRRLRDAAVLVLRNDTLGDELLSLWLTVRRALFPSARTLCFPVRERMAEAWSPVLRAASASAPARMAPRPASKVPSRHSRSSFPAWRDDRRGNPLRERRRHPGVLTRDDHCRIVPSGVLQLDVAGQQLTAECLG